MAQIAGSFSGIVTLPLLQPTMVFVIITGIISALQVYGPIYVMTVASGAGQTGRPAQLHHCRCGLPVAGRVQRTETRLWIGYGHCFVPHYSRYHPAAIALLATTLGILVQSVAIALLAQLMSICSGRVLDASANSKYDMKVSRSE